MPYTHLTPMERAKIELLQAQGHSRAEIARKLGRHPSTIGRELARNGNDSGYAAPRAQACYQQRRVACRPRMRLAYAPLRDFVNEKIALARWSPELIAGILPRYFPHDPRMRVCHESIYQAIYTPGHYLDYLNEYLPQARPKRRKRGQGKTRRAPAIAQRTSIAQRPAAVEQRVQTGHWEGDLIVGKGQDGFILTLVERSARLLHTVKLHTRRAAEVSEAVQNALMERPTSWVRTITFDNGSEFAAHQRITETLGAQVYFADPYAAYQRGSNEQVNGLLRRYLPKGTPFANLSQQRLQEITDAINDRPRKCLGYQTPNEVFQLQRKKHQRALSS